MNDVVLIGAGISGLAAAWELRRRGIAPLILERTARAGGVILTERVGGFVIDGGPDSLLVQKPAAVELCRELGLGDRLMPTLPPRTAFVLKRGRLVPLPDASFLGLPTRVGPFVRSPLFSLGGKIRMATELLRARGVERDESIAHFIGRRFGREAVEYLAEPLLAGIHAGDVHQLSIHSLFPRLVALEQAHGSILRGLSATPTHTASTQGAFVSLPTGIAELPEALAKALGPDVFRYNTSVRQISGSGPYKLTLDTDQAIHARVVIVTVPAWSAAQMLASLDTPLAMRSADIPYASTATVAFGLGRDQIRHPLDGSGFVVPRRERQMLMAATWVSSKWPHRAPDGHVLLRAFVGGATDPAALHRNDDDLAELALGELSALLDITGEPSLVRVFRWVRATPQYTVGHAERVRVIEERLARFPGVFVTGSGYRGTGIPDCIADARATAAKAAALI
ncbi:MAG TPA: protoporphyrinogen oxidase [Vicinamibacterales bacterium]|nr:protoporphyrinogen oxidase [Vicinamibacterales bacterium]